jgi:two-component system, NarL family, nitrate/nitrite response regulator NarL
MFVRRDFGSADRSCRWCGTGGIAVDAAVAPDHTVARGPDSQGLRVLVVWGVRFLGEGLAEILARDPLLSVVGLCADLSEAVALAPALQPDVVLLDARIPEAEAAVRRALDIAPGMRIVASGVRETEDDIVTWAEAGVIGYIPGTAALGDFMRLVTEIHDGEQYCSSRVAAGLLRRVGAIARRSTSRNIPISAHALTRREWQVAELIRSGFSDKEIARRLNISLATTKSHVHNLLGKLNLRRRNQVADYVREYGQRSR